MAIIKVNQISYKYPLSDNFNLKNIEINIEKGKLYTIIGKNGSGKTTLCNLFRGFIPNFYKGELTGNVFIEGKELSEWGMGDLAKKIGFVFENPFAQISGVRDTVFDEIGYGLENLGVEVDNIKSRVQTVLNWLGISDLKDKNPFELSGGQKQRVAFASIVAMDPEILVIDEPTSQLDPKGTEEIFKIIQLLKEQGKTIILVEHKLELIAKYSDYTYVMNDGQVVYQGKTRKVLASKKLFQYGCGVPQYALLGLEMRNTFSGYNDIPTTKKEALDLLMKRIERDKNYEYY